MTRAERLLQLMQLLRMAKTPVSGATMAEALGVSLRTLYRDIASLQAQGARVEGEAGLGYVLRGGFLLPPLMFSAEELEALALGLAWVQERGDSDMAPAARQARVKISAVLPPALQQAFAHTGLLVGPGELVENASQWLPEVRRAIRHEQKLLLTYADGAGVQSKRVVWPFAIGFFDCVRIISAWCELRQGFRHFRSDRIVQLAVLEQDYPRRREVLLQEWMELENIHCAHTTDKI